MSGPALLLAISRPFPERGMTATEDDAQSARRSDVAAPRGGDEGAVVPQLRLLRPASCFSRVERRILATRDRAWASS